MDLKKLAREKGTNLKQVAEKCGIPPTTLYAISRGDTNFDNVGIGIAIKVADALGMTVEELYTGKEHTVPVLTLDWEERQLVRLYRSLDEEHRNLLMSTAKTFAVASEKDGDVDGGAVLAGTVDAVKPVG